MSSPAAWALWLCLAATGAQGQSLDRAVEAVAASVAEARPEAPVGLQVRAEAPALAQAFSAVLASRLAVRGLPAIVLEEGGEGTARRRGARSLVRLHVGLDKGRLVARGALTSIWKNFWAGRMDVRAPESARALATFESSVEGDTQVQLLAIPENPGALPPPRSERGLLVCAGSGGQGFGSGVTLPSPLAALAAGDLDGDGGDEIIALTSETVHVFSASGAVLARRELSHLPLSESPAREPFGAAALLSRPTRLAVFSSRFARGEVLSFDSLARSLSAVGTLESPVIPGMERIAFVPGQARFEATGEPPFVTAAVAGDTRLVVRDDGRGTLIDGLAGPAAVQGLGAGSSLVDLDGNGQPEIVSTSPLLFPSTDSLRWLESPTGRLVSEVSLGPGRALYVVPLRRGAARPEVLVGLWMPDGTSALRSCHVEGP